MLGDLFLYHDRLSAFESGRVGSNSCLVLVGGLTDGFLTIPYSEPLSTWTASVGWSLVQMIMKSSYNGFGTSRLEDDSIDIEKLVEHLRVERGKQRIYLLGHSTGCQDILYSIKCQRFKEHNTAINGIILQGGVSDRDYLSICFPERYEALTNWARTVKSDGENFDTLFPTLIDNVAFTARRIFSLYDPNGEEDYFSRDLTVTRRKEKLDCLDIATFVVFSGEDEYVPGTNSQVYEQILLSYRSAVPEAQIFKTLVIREADHGISNLHHQQVFFSELEHFLKSGCPGA